MNAKVSVFIFRVEAIIYLILYSFPDGTFNISNPFFSFSIVNLVNFIKVGLNC